MQLRFTRHAKNRMRWRKISNEEIMSIIVEPDKREPFVLGKTHLSKSIGKRRLRITVSKEQGSLVILSVVDKRN